MCVSKSPGQAYLAAAIQTLQSGLQRIQHCVGQLEDAQVWWRPHETMNSIANLLLHLCGNLTQWIIAGVTQQEDQRNRPQEFAERRYVAKGDLLARLKVTVLEAEKVLAEVAVDQLLEPRRIQGFEGTVLSTTFDSLTHFSGHVQEIIYITRLQLGDRYRFFWVPTTPEQGSPQSE
jgi:hypothetical protein